MRRTPALRVMWALALVWTAAACGSEPSDGEDLDIGPDDSVPQASVELELEPPDDGFQVETRGALVPAGEESEWCEVAIVDGDPDKTWVIDRIENVHTPFIHHYFVMAARPGSQSEAAMQEALDNGEERIRCSGGVHGAWGTELDPVIISGVSTASNRGSAELPEGVGFHLQGGQLLAFNYHFLNSSLEDVEAKQKFNFYQTQEEGELQQMQYFSFNNLDIYVPPNGTWSTEMSRTFTQDIYIALLARHTHDLGRDFNVWWHEGPNDGEPVFTSRDTELDAMFPFDEPVRVNAGEGFRFECNFANTSDRSVEFGPKASDEMCVLLGAWWPVNPDEAPKNQTFYKFARE